MSEKKDIQKHLANILYTGHHHTEVKEWVMCKTCEPRIAKWQAEKELLKAQYPNEFIKHETKTEAQRLKEADALFDGMRAKGSKIRVEIK